MRGWFSGLGQEGRALFLVPVLDFHHAVLPALEGRAPGGDALLDAAGHLSPGVDKLDAAVVEFLEEQGYARKTKRKLTHGNLDRLVKGTFGPASALWRRCEDTMGFCVCNVFGSGFFEVLERNPVDCLCGRRRGARGCDGGWGGGRECFGRFYWSRIEFYLRFRCIVRRGKWSLCWSGLARLRLQTTRQY